MAKFKVILEVDLDQLKRAREEAGADPEEDITESISQELGWVNASGISVVEVKK